MTEQTHRRPLHARDELLQIAGRAVRERGLQEHDRPRHRRRRRHPERLASTTTSTPRSRWSTRSCRPSSSELFAQYDEILAGDRTTRGPSSRRPCGCRSRRSTTTTDEVAIFQNDADYLGRLRPVRLPRRAQRPHRTSSGPACSARPSRRRAARATSTSSWSTASSATPSGWRSRWYRPGGALATDEVAAQYLTILLDGITTMSLQPHTSSTPSGRRSASAAARSPTCTRPTSAVTC